MHAFAFVLLNKLGRTVFKYPIDGVYDQIIFFTNTYHYLDVRDTLNIISCQKGEVISAQIYLYMYPPWLFFRFSFGRVYHQ